MLRRSRNLQQQKANANDDTTVKNMYELHYTVDQYPKSDLQERLGHIF